MIHRPSLPNESLSLMPPPLCQCCSCFTVALLPLLKVANLTVTGFLFQPLPGPLDSVRVTCDVSCFPVNMLEF
jgi:hypothetical protein